MGDIFDQIAGADTSSGGGTATAAPTQTLGDIFDQIAVAAQPADKPLSLAEKVLGYSRSYLAGPTFGFGDNVEAAVAAPFTGNSYSDELAGIQSQQNRFKDKTDYLDNAVELASGAILNPVGELRTLAKGAEIATNPLLRSLAQPGIKTAVNVATSVPAQAALSAVGADNGVDSLGSAAKGALVGTGLSAAGSVVGNILQDVAGASDKLKLSSYGIGSADIAKQLKKLDANGVEVTSASDVPLLNTLKRAEQQGLIDPGNDILANAKGVANKQDELAKSLRTLLTKADDVIPNSKDFPIDNTAAYLDGLSGLARTKAENAATDELEALTSQMKTGSLADLQKAKIGLNYAHDDSPLTSSVQKALRSDLRQAIEDRVNSAADSGLIPGGLSGKVQSLNSEWGNLAELRDSFIKRGYKDLQGDVVEDTLGGIRTSGGTGSLNIASAASGNPIYAALGMGLNAARTPEAKGEISDALSDPAISKLLQGLGIALPETLSGRTTAAAYINNQKEKQKPKSLLERVLQVAPQSSAVTPTDKTEVEVPKVKFPDPRIEKLASNVSLDLTPLDKAQILAESAANPNAVGPKTKYGQAKGLMQLLDTTGAEWAKKIGIKDYDPFDPEQNIKVGKAYRDYLIDKYDGDVRLGLAAYNYGPTNLQKLLNKYGDSYSAIENHLPEETFDYVKKITGSIEV